METLNLKNVITKIKSSTEWVNQPRLDIVQEVIGRQLKRICSRKSRKINKDGKYRKEGKKQRIKLKRHFNRHEIGVPERKERIEQKQYLKKKRNKPV